MNIKETLNSIGLEGFSLSGQIVKVYRRRTGTGQYGDWSFQGAILKDESGEGSITFNGWDDVESRVKGKKVTLTPSKSSDMKVEMTTDDEGKEYVKVMVGKNAQLLVEGEKTSIEKHAIGEDGNKANREELEKAYRQYVLELRSVTFRNAVDLIMESAAGLGVNKGDIEGFPTEERISAITGLLKVAQAVSDTHLIALTRKRD